MSPLDRWYVDLSLVTFLTGLAVLVITAGLTGVVRMAVAVPLVTVVPGYAVVSLLYPTAGTHATRTFDENERGLQNPLPTKDGLDSVERLVFSVLATLVVVPVVAVAANFTPWGITLWPILFGLAGITMLCTVGALIRRARLPAEQRYTPQFSVFFQNLTFSRTDAAFSASSDRTRLFNLALAVCVLVLASSVGYAALTPPQGDDFTEFYVETETVDGDTQLLYPAQFESGESRELSVNVTNQEHEQVEYEVLVELQRVDGTGANATVVEREQLDSQTATIAHEETRTMTFDVAPSMQGSDLRFVLYLYRGQAPDDPTIDGAYQTLRLPITVGAGG